MNSRGEVKRASFLPTMCCRTSSPICLTVCLRSKCNDLSWTHYCCSCSQRCPPVHRLPSIQLCKEPRRSSTLQPASQTFTFFPYVDRSGMSILIWVILTRKSGERTGPSHMPLTHDICLNIWDLYLLLWPGYYAGGVSDNDQAICIDGLEFVLTIQLPYSVLVFGCGWLPCDLLMISIFLWDPKIFVTVLSAILPSGISTPSVVILLRLFNVTQPHSSIRNDIQTSSL